MTQEKGAAMETRFTLPTATLAVLALALLCPAAEPTRNARGVLVEGVRNDQPAFMVRVDVDHPDRFYQTGDELLVRVRSDRNGYRTCSIATLPTK